MAEEKNAPAIAEMSYDEAIKALEAIVAQLEREEHPLEEALALYEQGQALLQHCRALLEKAELKVQQLAGESLAPLALDEDEQEQ